jgi:hypothetical protein
MFESMTAPSASIFVELLPNRFTFTPNFLVGYRVIAKIRAQRIGGLLESLAPAFEVSAHDSTSCGARCVLSFRFLRSSGCAGFHETNALTKCIRERVDGVPRRIALARLDLADVALLDAADLGEAADALRRGIKRVRQKPELARAFLRRSGFSL